MTAAKPLTQAIASDRTVGGQGLSRGFVWLLAVTVGAAAGLLVSFAQVGYVIGLAFIVPLGDLFDCRTVGPIMLLGAALAAIGCAAAPDLPALAIALCALGLFAAIAQILIPLAVMLAPVEEKGRVVGTVSSGLVTGMLLARIISGLVAGIGGFRLIFAIAAVVMAVLSFLLWCALPKLASPEKGTYLSLLNSTIALVVEEQVLRQRMAIAGLQMAGFMLLWTPIAFLLSGPPYHYGVSIIGLFGLAGTAGAIMAPIAGRIGDRGYGGLTVTVALLTLSLAGACWRSAERR